METKNTFLRLYLESHFLEQYFPLIHIEAGQEKREQHMKGSSAGGFNNRLYLILFTKNVLIHDLLKQGRLQYLSGTTVT